jgi:hypothetical protein
MVPSLRAWTLAGFLALGTFGPNAQAQDAAAVEPAARKDVDVSISVDGRTTTIVISAARATGGDLEASPGPAVIKTRLAEQRIRTKQAEASYVNARLTREVAEIAVTEYKEGILQQDLKTLEAELALAKSDVERAQDRADWANRMVEKGFVSKAQVVSEQMSVQRAKFALEQARTKKAVLNKYTKDKTIKELTSEVEKARSDELSKQATWALEKSKEAELLKQSGSAVTSPPLTSRIRSTGPVEVETTVRDGKLIIRVTPDDESKPGEK